MRLRVDFEPRFCGEETKKQSRTSATQKISGHNKQLILTGTQSKPSDCCGAQGFCNDLQNNLERDGQMQWVYKKFNNEKAYTACKFTLWNYYRVWLSVNVRISIPFYKKNAQKYMNPLHHRHKHWGLRGLPPQGHSGDFPSTLDGPWVELH